MRAKLLGQRTTYSCSQVKMRLPFLHIHLPFLPLLFLPTEEGKCYTGCKPLDYLITRMLIKSVVQSHDGGRKRFLLGEFLPLDISCRYDDRKSAPRNLFLIFLAATGN